MTNTSWDWEDESRQYSERKFYTRATGRFGQKDNIRVGFPPELNARMAALVASGRVKEYKTPQDFVRDAVVHRLAWLNNNHDRLASDEEYLRLLTWQESIEKKQAEMESLNRICDNLEDGLSRASYLKDDLTTENLLLEAEIQMIHTREPYKSRIEGLIRRYRR